jgi:hypothetical protein
MKKAIQQLYDQEYRKVAIPDEEELPQAEKSFLASYLEDAVPNTIEDEFRHYITGQQTRVEPGKLYSWWSDQSAIPTVRQMAFDHLSIPGDPR